MTEGKLSDMTIEKVIEKASRYLHNKENINKIKKAYEVAFKYHEGQFRKSGDPYISHPLEICYMLTDLSAGPNTICAGMLHDTIEDTDYTYEKCVEDFGEDVASIVDGVTKIGKLKYMTKEKALAKSHEKILVAMAKDIRVILVKLVDRVHNMRTMQFQPKDKQVRISRETLDLYAPLAHRLGMYRIKSELEDLSFKYLDIEKYNQLSKKIKDQIQIRGADLDAMEDKIKSFLADNKIQDYRITSRVKGIFSVNNKMQDKNKSFHQIYDLLALRIVVNTIEECYRVLGLVHSIWNPIPARFKDYIAVPKSNKYQSLHTTVMTENGKILEVQIRTYKMHETAEYGVAAHWLYKKGRATKSFNQKDIAIVNKLKKWNTLSNSNTNFLDDLKKEILEDTIYVFTPAGDIFEMPAGATAIDFAYHIHSEVGNHCVSAKADGYIIPLGKELKNTQVIEILTNNSAHPRLDWLRTAKTSRARSKIRQWLNRNDDSVIIGKNIVAKKKPVQHAAEHKHQEAEQTEPLYEDDTVITEVLDTKKIGFRVNGEKNLMISFGKCCSPKPGDVIIGYISVGRGIIVHKKNCPNLKHIKNFKERSVDVEWEALSPKATRRFKVSAKRTHDLFAEIEGAIKKYRGHLIEGKLIETENNKLSGYFTMEIENKDDFKKVAKSIRTIPSILSINTV